MLAVLMIYLIPGIPKDLVGYVAGISEMKFRPFIILSTIGRSPAMLCSLLIGYFFERGNYTAMVAVTVMILAIVAACLIKRKSLIAYLDSLEEKAEENNG